MGLVGCGNVVHGFEKKEGGGCLNRQLLYYMESLAYDYYGYDDLQILDGYLAESTSIYCDPN